MRNDFPSIPFQRSRSLVEITARWHDTMGLVWCLKPSMKKIEKVNFLTQIRFEWEFERRVWILFFSTQKKHTKAVTWSNEGPSCCSVIHESLGSVWLTTHLCTWCNAGAWSGRNCLLLETLRGCLEIAVPMAVERAISSLKKMGWTFSKKTTHFGPIFFMRQRWSEATTPMNKQKISLAGSLLWCLDGPESLIEIGPSKIRPVAIGCWKIRDVQSSTTVSPLFCRKQATRTCSPQIWHPTKDWSILTHKFFFLVRFFSLDVFFTALAVVHHIPATTQQKKLPWRLRFGCVSCI